MNNLYVALCISLVFLIFLFMNVQVFLFQRTLRKLAIRNSIPQSNLSFLYPDGLLKKYKISKLRWVFLVAVFFFNWKVGLCCLFFNFVIYIIIPEQSDYKNLRKMQKQIPLDSFFTEMIVKMIASALYEISNDERFKMIGMKLKANIEDSDETVEGIIYDIDDNCIDGYKVNFDKDVGFNNSYPSRVQYLNKKTIDGIMSGDIKGSFIHLIIRD